MSMEKALPMSPGAYNREPLAPAKSSNRGWAHRCIAAALFADGETTGCNCGEIDPRQGAETLPVCMCRRIGDHPKGERPVPGNGRGSGEYVRFRA